MDRRTFLSMAAGGVAFGVASGVRGIRSLAQDKPSPAFREIVDGQLEAVEKGLEWLSRSQSSSGSVSSMAPVAFTAVAGLSFLASGSTPTRGRYSANVKKALKYIMDCGRGRDGYINEGGGGRGRGGSGMHGHGYGLLFLSEVCGMCGDSEDPELEEKLRDTIVRAVKCTEQAQDPNGGWTYDPSPHGHEGSVTVTQVQALRAARNAGITVPRTVIEKGISYIKKSTSSDGSIMYSLGQGGGGTYALTAAGACVFSYYGIDDAPEAKRCRTALYDFITGKRGGREGHDAYSSFYAGQACFFMKKSEPKFWSVGYDKVRQDILNARDKGSGGWLNDGYNGAFGTGCATLVLQIPLRLLPIFQD